MKREAKNAKLKPWTTISSEIAHKNNWYKIRHDKFILPNGEIGDYYILDNDQSAFVIPVRNGKIILGKQFRYPVKKWSIEVPGGGVKNGYTVLKAAKEELLEEAGYTGKFKKIGKFMPFNGVSQENCTVFLATDLKFVGTKLEESELIKSLEIPIKKVYEMIENGKINDGMTIASLTIAKKYLLKK